MTENIDSILVRIKKILALSKHNDNEEEAASAAAMAQELLLRHNLTEDMLGGVKTEKPKEPYVRKWYTGHRKGKNEDRWKVDLSFAVAKANLCKVVHHGGYRGQSQLAWIGQESNIEVAQFLFETLAYDLEQIADRAWKQVLAIRNLEKTYGASLFTNDELRTVHGKAWKKGFFTGAIWVIRSRLEKNLDHLEQDQEIKALVVVNDNELKMATKRFYGKLGHYNSGGHSSMSGFETGKIAGRDIQFKTGVGSGGSHGPKLIERG